MANLHIMNDEKVVSRAIMAFEEAVPQNDKFIILSPKNKCRYVKIDLPNVFYVDYDSSDFWEIAGDIKKYQYIIIHYLSFSAAKFITKINHTGIVWVIWGADLYNNILRKKGYKLYDEQYKEVLYTFLTNPIRTLKEKYKLFINRKKIVKALFRIKYAACFPDQDLQLLKQYYPDLTIKHKKFFYYPIDEIVGALLDNRKLGNNIILGNSASFSNNHNSVLRTLSKCTLDNRKIITPLSYGVGIKYVERSGFKYFPNSFNPITRFMPINEYNDLLLSARTFIYGHYRQEAFGNILTAFYIGGVVFLYSKNPLYSSLKQLGFIFFDIEELPSLIDYHLTEDEKKKNHKLCCDLYSKQVLMECIKNEFINNRDL